MARTILALVHNRKATVIHAMPRNMAQITKIDLESCVGTGSIGTAKRFLIMSVCDAAPYNFVRDQKDTGCKLSEGRIGDEGE